MPRTISVVSASPCFRASKTTKSFPRPCIFRNAVMAAYIGGCLCKSQWPIDLRIARFLNVVMEQRLQGFFMRAGSLVATIAVCLAAIGAAESKGARSMDDPYAWLEDVHGQKPLAWVHEQNGKALKILKGDPRYQSHYATILAFLDAQDRIPFGSLGHQYVFNFWQDAGHPKGLWRRTSIADYARPSPDWDVLIDLDKLAADEH